MTRSGAPHPNVGPGPRHRTARVIMLVGMEWTPDRIRAARRRAGLDQQQLGSALRAAVGKGSRRAVIDWERGAAGPQTLARRGLDQVLGEFYDEPPEPVLLGDATLQQCLDRIAAIGRAAALI